MRYRCYNSSSTALMLRCTLAFQYPVWGHQISISWELSRLPLSHKLETIKIYQKDRVELQKQNGADWCQPHVLLDLQEEGVLPVRLLQQDHGQTHLRLLWQWQVRLRGGGGQCPEILQETSSCRHPHWPLVFHCSCFHWQMEVHFVICKCHKNFTHFHLIRFSCVTTKELLNCKIHPECDLVYNKLDSIIKVLFSH